MLETCADAKESRFFWSYNHGLTMTCSKVEEMPNNRYKLYNLQIVNGCQTSNAIYLAVKNKERVAELQKRKKRKFL
ncbi:MAG: AIPR family protein [Saprospiraceae bacterium]|nr:AIPR family protein [Saprospiraceae bacterium]